METKWAIILLASLLAALTQQCESGIFELEREHWILSHEPSPLSQRLLNALKRLDLNSKTEPEEFAAKLREAAAVEAGGEHGDYHDIFQALASVIQETEPRCPEELFSLIEASIGLRLKWWHGNDEWIVGPINGFLKTKIAPKLDECVKSVVETYAGREELDVLEPLDGFFEAAFGPDWPAKLPKFEFTLEHKEVNAEKATAFIIETDLTGFGGRRNPAGKIKKFLDDKCERIQAFEDVAAIELVNAIDSERFPHEGPPPEAKSELPERLLKIKNYYRICVHWRHSIEGWTGKFIKSIAQYDSVQRRSLARYREWRAQQEKRNKRTRK
jgi:hypothetical protein